MFDKKNNDLDSGFEDVIQHLLYGDISNILELSSEQLHTDIHYSEDVKILIHRGLSEYRVSNFSEALSDFEAALEVIRIHGSQHNQTFNLLAEAFILSEIGQVSYRLGDVSEALVYYNAALSKLMEKQSTLEQVDEFLIVKTLVLHYIAEADWLQGNYSDAIALAEKALSIIEGSEDYVLKAMILSNLGAAYNGLADYYQSIQYQENAFTIVQAIDEPYFETLILSRIGSIALNQSRYTEAMSYFQQSLSIAQEIQDRAGQARAVNGLGTVLFAQGNYLLAIEKYEQALNLRQSIGGDHAGQGRTFTSLGQIYIKFGDYDQARDWLQQALNLQQERGYWPDLAYTFVALATVALSEGQYALAQSHLDNASTIFAKAGSRAGEGQTLNNYAGIYYSIGEFETALELYQQVFEISKTIGTPARVGNALNNLGLVYVQLDRDTEALQYFQQALAIRRGIGNRLGVASTLNNIGLIYQQQRNYAQALDAVQRSLTIRQELGDRSGEATALNNIALIYEEQDQFEDALDTYQEALSIFQEIGNQAGERLTLSNLGYLWEQQGNIELAIIFYKDSVRVTEQIRFGLNPLPSEQQQVYTNTVADVYRRLADLLLSQERILEAQQVLELLKEEELETFLENRQASPREHPVILLPSEEEIIALHGSLVEFGKELSRCEKRGPCQQLQELRDKRDQLKREFNDAINTLASDIRDLRKNPIFFDPAHMSREARDIISAQSGTVLIYPFVLEERLWLLWATEGRISSKREVSNVDQETLTNTVVQLREALEDPNSNVEDLQTISQKLYTWLIAPLEDELQVGEFQHLVFALDRSTRYIPMGVLFDGEKYLTERFTVTTILSAELTNMDDRLSSNLEDNEILAVGVTEALADFNPLPNVRHEVEAIVREDDEDEGIYSGTQLLNEEFDFSSLRDHLLGRRLLHIATHGEFVAGRHDESFLLLGNGERLPISEIEVLEDYLDDVHLVVLSACETALGGARNDGIEIAGTSFYFLKGGAEAVIASLWRVNDGSTSLLMQQFYQNLAQGSTKAQALQQARLALLKGDIDPEALASLDRSIVEWDDDSEQPYAEDAEQTQPNLAHPYYWAPFILIGNGL